MDLLTLVTAVAGTIVLVASMIRTQQDSVGAQERAAKSLEVLTKQANASELQARASMAIASATSRQVAGLGTQLEEMQSQSRALQIMAGATSGQLAQASIYNRLSLSVRVSFEREQRGVGDAGLFIVNYGTGPATIQRLHAYLDGRRLENVSDLEYVDSYVYGGTTPGWNNFEHNRTIPAGARLSVFWTDAANISIAEEFRRLTTHRIFIIAQACSMYQECVTFCTATSNDRCADFERTLLGRAPAPEAIGGAA